MSWKASLVAVALAAAVCPTLSYAQNNPGGGGGGNGGGGGGGRQRMDPAQFQQQMMDRIKEQLKAQDDEWRVIEPKLTKVLNAQRDARAGGGFGGFGGGGGGRRGGGPGGGGGGGGGGGQDQQPTTKLGLAQRDLRTALDSDASSPEDVDKKLAAYRAARTEAQTQLDNSRKELKEVLTPKQEAQLVLMGMLE